MTFVSASVYTSSNSAPAKSCVSSVASTFLMNTVPVSISELFPLPLALDTAIDEEVDVFLLIVSVVSIEMLFLML